MNFGLPKLGKVIPISSKEVKSSQFGVGFEKLYFKAAGDLCGL